jgi:invasion protein IalB
MPAKFLKYVTLAAGLFASPLAAQDTYRSPSSEIEVGDWSLECFADSNVTPKTCQAYHRVLMNNATQIALVAAFTLPKNSTGLLYQIALPLGIDILTGVTLTVDIDYSVRLPITRCTMQGCLLEGILTDAPFDALMQGKNGTLTIQIPGQGALAIPMSLNGFSEAINQIEAILRPETAKPEADVRANESEIETISGTDPNVSPVNSDQVNQIEPRLAPVTGGSN